MLFLFKLIYRKISSTALQQILQGRLRQRGLAASGRFLGSDVKRIYRETWQEMAEILPEVRMQELPNWGNRHNVYLAVLSISLYHALLNSGIEKDYAIELFADIGWKLYVKFLAIPKAIARIRTSVPQEQMNLVLKAFLRFPFSAPGQPGYEVEAGATESGAFATDWSWCPPFAFVRRYVEQHGDRGELRAFFHSWCQYDWALADAIVEGTGHAGAYTRPHTLSRGDDICDMVWAAQPKLES